MKKIFTLVAATLFTVAVFAADRRPVVTLKAPRNYEIVIDGQSYFANNSTINLSNMRGGQHTIKVYESARGFMFRKSRRLVSASSFAFRGNDVDIIVGLRGQISVQEDRFDRDRKGNDRDYNDHGYGQNNDRGKVRDNRNGHF